MGGPAGVDSQTQAGHAASGYLSDPSGYSFSRGVFDLATGLLSGGAGGAGRKLVGTAMSSFIGGAFLNSAQQLVANGKVNAWEALISGGLSSSFGSIAHLVVPGFYGGMLQNAMRRESTAIYTGIGILMESYVRMIAKVSTEMSQ